MLNQLIYNTVSNLNYDFNFNLPNRHLLFVNVFFYFVFWTKFSEKSYVLNFCTTHEINMEQIILRECVYKVDDSQIYVRSKGHLSHKL